MQNSDFIGIFTAVTLGFMIGLADDAYGTKPLLKFLGQLSCGLILIASGIFIHITPYMWLNYLFTLFWVVGIMNSINMLDNMDAVTTTTSILIIIAALILIVLYHDFTNIYVMMMLGVLASLLGFLYFNWHPSKMYMGDTGSQFIGFVLAAFSIIYLWNFENNGTIEPTRNILLVLAAFVLPIADTFTVTINRIIRGISPFVGGKDHTTHHLNYLGCNDMQVGFIFVALSLSSAAVVCWACMIPAWSTINTVLLATYSVIIIIGMYSTTQIKKAKDEFLKHGKS